MAHQPPVTLSDVARRAGVSLATASRVINGSSRTVRKPFRDRVLRAASELRYTPNAHAQAIARGTSNVVGLVVHDISDPYFASIAAGVMRSAEEVGMAVLLGSTWRDPDRELSYVAMLRSQRVRALIVAGSRSVDRSVNQRLADQLAEFASGGGHVACIGQSRLGVDTVQPQNRAGARDLARALVELGHRRFVILAGPEHLLTAQDRLVGFRSGLTEAGLDAEALDVRHGAFTRDGGYDLTAKLAAEATGATCVFAVNDVMAVGAMAALRDAGLRIPDDLSVAGFDDIATLRDQVPPLTTVGLPLEDMGVKALAMALEGGQRANPRIMRIKGEVIIRASTKSLV